MNLRSLIVQTLGHLCVDATCAAIVISQTSVLSETFAFFIFYNFLAFCLQPFAGLALDTIKKTTSQQYILIAFTLLLLAFIPTFNLWIRVLLVGIGNCLFHTGAGALVLTQSNKKLTHLGIFVSSGAVGLMLGTVFAHSIICHTILLMALVALLVLNIHIPSKRPHLPSSKIYWLPVFLLCLCITIRSFFGFMPLTHFVETPWSAVLITMAVFLGKSSGGILCDRFGIQKTVIVSTIFVISLFLLSLNSPYLWAIVQIIVNLSMPITLYLMWQAIPRYPAFSFGLAACCLVIGLLATFLVMNIEIEPIYLLFLFVLNSGLILFSERKVK